MNYRKQGNLLGLLFIVTMMALALRLLLLNTDGAEAQYSSACYNAQGGAMRVASAGCEFEFQSGSVLDIQDGTTLTFGADGNYPLGYASADQELACGTQTITATAQITPTGLTTVTYALATLATDPAATASIVSIDDPTTSTITINVWESDFTAGTTGALVHWCAVGD